MLKSLPSREIIRQLETAGWVQTRVNGSHHHFRHPTLPGVVTVPHPAKDLPTGTLRSIQRQSGVTFV